MSPPPDAAQYKGLCQQHLYLVIAPVLRWERLKEHDDSLQGKGRGEMERVRSKGNQSNRDIFIGGTYLKVHVLQLVAPFGQECATNVEMKLGEGVWTF